MRLPLRCPIAPTEIFVPVEVVVVIALPVECRDRALDVPPQHETLVGERQDEGHEEEEHRESASIPHLLIHEAGLEQGYGHSVRGAQRTALGHNPDPVSYTHLRAHETDSYL